MAADKTNEFYPLLLRYNVSHLSRGPWVSLPQRLLLCVQLRGVWRVVEERRPLPFQGQYLCVCWGLYSYPKLVKSNGLSEFPLLSSPFLGTCNGNKLPDFTRAVMPAPEALNPAPDPDCGLARSLPAANSL